MKNQRAKMFIFSSQLPNIDSPLVSVAFCLSQINIWSIITAQIQISQVTETSWLRPNSRNLSVVDYDSVQIFHHCICCWGWKAVYQFRYSGTICYFGAITRTPWWTLDPVLYFGNHCPLSALLRLSGRSMAPISAPCRGSFRKPFET